MRRGMSQELEVGGMAASREPSNRDLGPRWTLSLWKGSRPRIGLKGYSVSLFGVLVP